MTPATAHGGVLLQGAGRGSGDLLGLLLLLLIPLTPADRHFSRLLKRRNLHRPLRPGTRLNGARAWSRGRLLGVPDRASRKEERENKRSGDPSGFRERETGEGWEICHRLHGGAHMKKPRFVPDALGILPPSKAFVKPFRFACSQVNPAGDVRGSPAAVFPPSCPMPPPIVPKFSFATSLRMAVVALWGT